MRYQPTTVGVVSYRGVEPEVRWPLLRLMSCGVTGGIGLARINWYTVHNLELRRRWNFRGHTNTTPLGKEIFGIHNFTFLTGAEPTVVRVPFKPGATSILPR